MSTLPQDPQSFRKAFAYRRRRAFFSFRRRSDAAWFVINICLFVFSITILIFKVKFEPPVVVEKVIEKTEIQQVPVPTATWLAEPEPMAEGGTIEQTSAKETPAAKKDAKKEPAKPEPKKTERPAAAFKLPPASPWDFLTQPWRTAAQRNGSVSLSEAETDAGKSVRISYDFASGSRVQAYQDLQFDLSVFKKISLAYFLAEGNPGTVELRIEDEGGGTYAYALDRTLDGQMRKKEILLSARPKSAAKALDWRRVRRLAVVIAAKSGGGSDAKGTLWLSELKAQ